jgi:hypothetical protein
MGATCVMFAGPLNAGSDFESGLMYGAEKDGWVEA